MSFGSAGPISLLDDSEIDEEFDSYDDDDDDGDGEEMIEEDQKMAAVAAVPPPPAPARMTRSSLLTISAVPSKATKNAGLIINLCGNQKKRKATLNNDGLINLCDSSDDDDEPAVAVLPMIAPPPPRQKRKRPDNGRRAKIPADAIVLLDYSTTTNATGQQKSEELTPDERYRRALGPWRMEFISGDFHPSAHAFTASPPPSRLPRTLTSELLEYQLNLPIAAHSSIFVRVQESRLDLLRVRKPPAARICCCCCLPQKLNTCARAFACSLCLLPFTSTKTRYSLPVPSIRPTSTAFTCLMYICTIIPPRRRTSSF
jgi:hypothetical protein